MSYRNKAMQSAPTKTVPVGLNNIITIKMIKNKTIETEKLF